MRSQRSLTLVVLTVLALAAGFVIYFWSSRKSRAISYHRQQYLALVQEYEQNIDAILKDEPRRYASVQAQVRERDALVRLGYLTETNIPFRGKWSQDLSQALWRAPLIDKDVASFTVPFTTNGFRVTRVRARPADVQAWKQIIEEHASK